MPAPTQGIECREEEVTKVKELGSGSRKMNPELPSDLHIYTADYVGLPLPEHTQNKYYLKQKERLYEGPKRWLSS